MIRNKKRRRAKFTQQQTRRKCVVCGDYLIGQRRGARYCSSACRQAAYRLRADRVAYSGVPTSSQWSRAAAEAQRLLDQAARLMGR